MSFAQRSSFSEVFASSDRSYTPFTAVFYSSDRSYTPFTMVFYPSDRSYTPFTVVFYPSDRSYTPFTVVFFSSDRSYILFTAVFFSSDRSYGSFPQYFAHLFVLWRSAEGTLARKFSSKLGISLTYSYLCSRKQNVDRFGLLATTQKNAKKQVFVA